ncbi:MAG: GLPGLI family protein [Bacteroides sp.]|nr:GLPGLI family protein [Bacteroides sp.]
MNKLIIYVALLAWSSVGIYAQVAEHSFLDVFYRMSFKKDTTQQVTTDDLMTLRIGKRTSIFFSNTSYTIDSLLTSPDGQSLQMDIISNGSKKYGKRIVSYTVLKDFGKNEIEFTDNVGGDHYRYTEAIPELRWQIASDKKEIGDFQCQKATCTFRGRRYEAWFTTDLPINNGPWKFQGLPGLIVEVYDANREYAFVYVGHKQSDSPICSLPHKYITTDRLKYQKAYRNFIKDPVAYIAAVSGMTITLSDSKKKDMAKRQLKYDLIERE